MDEKSFKFPGRVVAAGAPDGASAQFDSHVVPSQHRFPHSLVWTPIPILTWLFPFIGHLAITDSAGIIYDFAAPFTINIDNMAFGWPTLFCQLNVSRAGGREVWDKCVMDANEVYRLRVHNLLCDNCHSHVAYALNSMQYRGRSNWNMASVFLLLLSKPRYVSKWHCFFSWLPFLIIFSIVMFVILLSYFH